MLAHKALIAGLTPETILYMSFHQSLSLLSCLYTVLSSNNNRQSTESIKEMPNSCGFAALLPLCPGPMLSGSHVPWWAVVDILITYRSKKQHFLQLVMVEFMLTTSLTPLSIDSHPKRRHSFVLLCFYFLFIWIASAWLFFLIRFYDSLSVILDDSVGKGVRVRDLILWGHSAWYMYVLLWWCQLVVRTAGDFPVQRSNLMRELLKEDF